MATANSNFVDEKSSFSYGYAVFGGLGYMRRSHAVLNGTIMNNMAAEIGGIFFM